jgi:imidazole glycerol-phosphate synthase subunit HisH
MIAIIDYKAGNLTSVALGFEAIGAEAVVTRDPDVIRAAERVVFPGVGAAGAAMSNLRALALIDVIHSVVASGTPFLGICLGTQILLSRSEEDGGTDCLNLTKGRVRHFSPTNPRDKVPHMGWNAVRQKIAHPVMANIDDDSEFYFVHSYYPDPEDESVILGTTSYADITFTSAIYRDNLVATQFHPEKSGRVGLRLLENFAQWDGTLS